MGLTDSGWGAPRCSIVVGPPRLSLDVCRNTEECIGDLWVPHGDDGTRAELGRVVL